MRWNVPTWNRNCINNRDPSWNFQLRSVLFYFAWLFPVYTETFQLLLFSNYPFQQQVIGCSFLFTKLGVLFLPSSLCSKTNFWSSFESIISGPFMVVDQKIWYTKNGSQVDQKSVIILILCRTSKSVSDYLI